MTVGAPISSVEVAGMGVSIRTVTVRRVPSFREPEGEMLSSVTTGQGGSPPTGTQRFSWASASPVIGISASVDKKANASNVIATATARRARLCSIETVFGAGEAGIVAVGTSHKGIVHKQTCRCWQKWRVRVEYEAREVVSCFPGEEDWPCLAVYRAPGRVGQTGPNAALSWEKPRQLSHFDSLPSWESWPSATA